MKLITLAGCALACAAAVALSGCQLLQGVAAVNTALLPNLKTVDMKIHTDTTCGDLAMAVLGQTSGTGTQLTGGQVAAIVTFCERRDATQILQLDPQAARQALHAVIGKAANPAGAVAAAASPFR